MSVVQNWCVDTFSALSELTISPRVHAADEYVGNEFSDGRWNYTWDAENRLIKIESLSSAPAGSKRRIAWEFDGKGKRIRQTTYDGSTGTYIATEDLKIISDGWRNIAELNATNNALLRSYTWGLDLSGSMGGAGGIGGLLVMKSAANGAHFFTYDGNGNVAALTKASDGTVSASYEYGPFGEVIRATGPMAKANPFRWSTKYQDDETDIVMYPGRPWRDGRFLSRDPVEEQGFILLMGDNIDDEADSANAGNLYRFVGNNPVNEFDPLGFWPSSSPFLGFLLGGIPLTHQNANQRELPVSPGELFVINYSSVDMDEAPDSQWPVNSYKHAMRNGPAHQPDADARARANAWVRENLSKAEDLLCNCGDAAGHLHALEFFGYALHTVQDSTSPAHNGRHHGGPIEFKPWYGLSGPINWERALRHVIKEDFDPGYGSRLDTATADLWKYFQCKSTAPAFPADFFTYGIDKKNGDSDY